MRTALRLVCLALAGIAAHTAQAQSDPARAYPTRPVRVVIGFVAGGTTDLITRLISQKLGEGLGQPVIVENRLGAGGVIATEAVVKAAPDGHTLLMAPSSTITVSPVMYKNLPYAPVRDFAPVSKVVTLLPLFLVVNVNDPIHSVKDLVAYTKTHPQKANYGGASGLFQLALEMFKIKTGSKMEFIPYKGGPTEAMGAIMAGHLLTALIDYVPVSGPLRSGKIRGLAVTSPKRMPQHPDVPTMAEEGIPELETQGFVGLFAPIKTPPAIVTRLEEHVMRILRQPDVMEKITALQAIPAGSSAREMAQLIDVELARWAAVARAAKIEPIDYQ